MGISYATLKENIAYFAHTQKDIFPTVLYSLPLFSTGS